MNQYLLNLWRRLQRALRRSTFERQLDDELRFHLESETADLIRRGMDPAEGRRRAMAAFGGLDRWREEARETRFGHQIELLVRDARLSFRTLRRAPSYTVPAVATLALGIAAMASIASLAYDVLFRPLPYDDPSRLVAIYERNIPRKRDRNVVSATALLAWRQRSRTLDSVSALMPDSRVWLTDAGAERVNGAQVSPSLFALLGRRPMLGTGFSAPARADEVILSYRFWSSRLGADSAIVGKTVNLGGVPVTVAGVMPPDFLPVRFGWMGEQEFWAPLIVEPRFFDWGRFLLVVARLGPGATIEGANREVHAIHAQLRAEGSMAEGWDSQVLPLTAEVSGSVRAPFYALLVACTLLLVMVLTNASLLTVAHASRRAADRSLRALLGATRSRLVAEWLSSTLWIALGGAALGLAGAMWGISALRRFLPADVPRLDSLHFGRVALAVGIATGVLAAVLLAMIPAIGERRRGAGGLASLQGGARLTRGVPTAWVVVAEAATALVLTLFASLTLRSFDRLSSVDVGFDASHLIAFRVSFDRTGVDQQTAAAESRAFLQRLRTVPGIVSVGRTSVRPLYQGGTSTTVTPPGFGDRDRSAFPTAEVRFVDAEYFRTLGLTPLSGRLFAPSDTRDAPLRVVVNEAFGRKLWPGERNLVGRSFDLRINQNPTPEIIGVVRDVRLANPRDEARPTVYVFSEQADQGETYDVLVRTAGSESAVIPAVRAAARDVAPAVPIYRVESMQQTVGARIARERVTAQLLLLFAAAALVLVAVGLYGLYAGEVTHRRREIGVRMALGATRTSVVRAMLTRALVRTAAGVAVGAAAGLAGTRMLESVLYGVRPSDPLSYAGAALLVLVVALAATIIPAAQASAVDPSLAMRAE